MYHHYTSRGSFNQTGGNRLKDRIRNVIILVLLAAVIALSIFGGQAMTYRAEVQVTYVQRMQTECSEALRLVGTLSRTAGANSAATLGRIRSHVYSMDTINQLHAGTGGQFLVGNDYFTSLYAVIDEYSDKLITGMQTGDLQTSLNQQLTTLQNIVGMLE